MKTEELMVGDWYYWEAEGKLYPYQVKPEDFVKGEIPNFQPVPLTSEILKKNGFQFDKIAEGFYLKLDTKYIIAYFLSDSETQIFINTFINKDVCLNTTIRYVHELQHALKLCKIDKEIVL